MEELGRRSAIFMTSFPLRASGWIDGWELKKRERDKAFLFLYVDDLNSDE